MRQKALHNRHTWLGSRLCFRLLTESWKALRRWGITGDTTHRGSLPAWVARLAFVGAIAFLGQPETLRLGPAGRLGRGVGQDVHISGRKEVIRIAGQDSGERQGLDNLYLASEEERKRLKRAEEGEGPSRCIKLLSPRDVDVAQMDSRRTTCSGSNRKC